MQQGQLDSLASHNTNDRDREKWPGIGSTEPRGHRESGLACMRMGLNDVRGKPVCVEEASQERQDHRTLENQERR